MSFFHFCRVLIYKISPLLATRMRALLPLCIALLSVSVLGVHPRYYHRAKIVNDIDVYWRVLDDTVYFSFTAPTQSAWAGLFLCNGRQGTYPYPGEAYIGTMVNNQPSVDVYLMKQDDMQKERGTPSIFDTSMTVEVGKTTVKFARKLMLPSSDRLQLEKLSNYQVFGAGVIGSNFTVEWFKVSSLSPMSIHGARDYWDGDGPSSGIIVHGILMFLLWGVLLPVGVLVARHFKHALPFWVRWHRLLQWSGVLFSLVAIILAFVTVKTHLAVAHAWVGLFVVLFGMHLQPIISLVRPLNSIHSSPAWTHLHWWTRRLSFVLAAIAILTGIPLMVGGCDWTGCDLGSSWQLNAFGIKWQIIFLVWLGVLCIAAVALECWTRKRFVASETLNNPLLSGDGAVKVDFYAHGGRMN